MVTSTVEKGERDVRFSNFTDPVVEQKQGLIETLLRSQSDTESARTTKESGTGLIDVLTEYKCSLNNLSPTTLELIIQERKADLEAYIERHDSTGALISELFHSKIGSLFRTGSVEVDNSTGHISINNTEDDSNLHDKHFLAISMNNLELANTEGGHAVGDKALNETYQLIQKALFDSGFSETTSTTSNIFHLKGADFVAILDKDSDPAAIEKLTAQINSQTIPVVDSLKLPYSSQLICTGFDISQFEQMFNRVQDQLPANEKYKFSEDGSDTNKIVSSVLVNLLEDAREHSILMSLLTQTSDLVNTGSNEIAEDYFEKYVQKFFHETEMEDYEFFEKHKNNIKSLIDSVDFASEKRILNSSTLTTLADSLISRILSSELSGEPMSVEISEKNVWNARHENLSIHKFTEDHYPRSAVYIGKIKDLHEGLYAFSRELVDENDSEQSLDVLKELPAFLKFYSHMTELIPSYANEISANVEILEQTMLSELPAEEKLLRLKLVTGTALKETETEMFSHDLLTGLNKKEQFYRKTYANVYQALLSGQEMSVIFGDLGNLKYTNDYGGRQTGNAELLAVTKVIEDSVEDENVTTCRYGGDEFSISFFGDTKKAEFLISGIKSRLSGNEKEPLLIPSSFTEMRQGFIPHPIQLDLGSSTLSEAKDTLEELVRYVNHETGVGLYSRVDSDRLLAVRQKLDGGSVLDIKQEDLEFYAANLTRLMVKIADSTADYRKGFNKMAGFLQLYQNSQEHGSPYSEVLKARWSYSKKSLQGRSINVLSEIQEKMKENGQNVFTREMYDSYFNRADVETEGNGEKIAVFNRVLRSFLF